jgi:hypothetical protein
VQKLLFLKKYDSRDLKIQILSYSSPDMLKKTKWVHGQHHVLVKMTQAISSIQLLVESGLTQEFLIVAQMKTMLVT